MKLAELVGIARPLEVTRHGLVQRLAVPPGGPWAGALATIKIVCDAPKNSEAVGSSNANSLCGGEFGWITGNLCDLSKGYFATTFLSSSSRKCAARAIVMHRVALGPTLPDRPTRLRGAE